MNNSQRRAPSLEQVMADLGLEWDREIMGPGLRRPRAAPVAPPAPVHVRVVDSMPPAAPTPLERFYALLLAECRPIALAAGVDARAVMGEELARAGLVVRVLAWVGLAAWILLRHG